MTVQSQGQPLEKQADEWSALPINVAPDGTITYDFDGHIHAQGLDLDQGLGPVAPIGSKVAWLNINGDEEGSISSNRNGFDERTMQLSESQPGTTLEASLGLFWDPSADRAEVTANAENSGGTGGSAVVIDSDENSDFLQLTALVKSRAILALISSAGAIVFDSTGGALAVAHPGVGVYNLSYPSIGAPVGGALAIATPFGVTASSIRANTATDIAATIVPLTAAGAAVNSSFSVLIAAAS